MKIPGLDTATRYTDVKQKEFQKAVNTVLKGSDLKTPLGQEEAWNSLVLKVFRKGDWKDLPFEAHKTLYDFIYAKRTSGYRPAPAWLPSNELEDSNLAKIMKERGISEFEQFHQWTSSNRIEFWDFIVDKMGVKFKREPTATADLSKGVESIEWLPGAAINIVDSCFRSQGNIAIYHAREGSSEIQKIRYSELETLVNRVANGLIDKGFQTGDVIAVDMPMNPESVAIYLGIIKAGCVALSIADSFPSPEIEKRLKIGNAKAVFTVDYYMRDGKRIELYPKLKEASAPQTIVVPWDGESEEPLRLGDLYWNEFLSSKPYFISVPRKPSDVTNILFSSGTTGDPKAIPWTHTTPIKAAVDAYLHHDIQADDILAWPTNLGWMMGPWLIYAAFLNKASIALFVGAPTTKEFGEFIQNSRVTMLGVIPSIVNSWKVRDTMKGLNWRNIRKFSSTGECSKKEDMLFLMSLAGFKPVIEYCGGTEIGGGYITSTMIQPNAPSTFTTPACGLDFVILDEEGNKAENGEVFIIPPSIGLSLTLLNEDHHKVYHEGTPAGPNETLLRRHGDQVERVGGGYYVIHGRADDTMKLGGIKVSSGEIERLLHGTPGIAETAAIAVPPKDGGPSLLVIYAVTKEKLDKDVVKKEFQKKIKEELNPLFKIHDVVFTDSLPRTASNKVMRRLLRKEYTELV